MNFSQAESVASRLEILTESASTNAAMRSLSTDAAAWPHLSVIVTDNQTAGRGRLDRSWIAPAGSALAVSVLLRELPSRPEAMGWIPLIAGVAMADAATAQLSAHEVAVKWPNDVLVDGKKICGILAESTGSAVIVGAGVNTAMRVDQLPVPTATSFAAIGEVCDSDHLIADYLRRLDGLLGALVAWEDSDRSGIRDAVSARCATLGRAVDVDLPDGSRLHGIATGIDADGRLLVEVAGVEHAVSAGDVVHARLS